MASPVSDVRVPISNTVLTIPVKFDEHWFVGGLRNMVLNTIFQGIITVLVIKQFVGVCRLLVKGSRQNRVKPNRMILWDMVESWEDLFKMACSLFFVKGSSSPERRQGKDADDHSSGNEHGRDKDGVEQSGKLNETGKRRLLVATIIAAAIFAADVVLIIVTLPSNRSIEGSRFQVATWDSLGKIVPPTHRSLIRGSLSKVIMLEPRIGGAEFKSKQSLSMERTDFADFKMPLTRDNVPLLNCTVETWRFTCLTRTNTSYYQYKLRLDLTPEDSESQYFARTTNFKIGNNERRDKEYASVIEKALKDFKAVSANTKFTRQSKATKGERAKEFDSELIVKVPNVTLVKDEVQVGNDPRTVRVHDLIASIVINSIQIRPTETTNPDMQERLIGTRPIRENKKIKGVIAQSQRPMFPLYGVLFLYLLLLAISIYLQAKVFNNVHSPEIFIVLEQAGQRQVQNVMNADVAPIKVQPRHEFAVEERQGFQSC